MIYLHLQNRLISNSHCLTYYNKLLYMCGWVGGGRGVILCIAINFADIYGTCNFAIPGTSIAGMSERDVQIEFKS